MNGENIATRNLVAQLNLGDAYKLSVNGPSVREVYSTPADLITILLPNIYLVASLLLFVYIFVAGFKMVMNPDSKKAKEDGKKSLMYALGGFILLLSVFWIMQIISTITGLEIL